MDTQEPLVEIVVSSKPAVEGEISQEEEKDNIHEPTVNAVVTQEPATKTKVGLKEVDEQKPVDITVTTQEPVVKMQVDQEGKETVINPTDEVFVTKELVAEAGHFHPQEAATPSMDSTCGRMQGSDEGWHFEKLLLLVELKKWKQLVLSLQEGVIPLRTHKIMMASLREKWVK